MPATLASFAGFVRDELMDEYVRLQIHLAGTIALPMMRLFEGIPAEEIAARTRQDSTEFLTYLAEGRGDEYIRISMARWRMDELGIIGKLQIEAADVTGINLLRKKVCAALLPHFSSNVADVLSIHAELDEFVHQNETQAFEQLTIFHKEVATSRRDFIERVSAAIPGTLYVFNPAHGTIEYINDHLSQLLGYTQAEFSALGSGYFDQNVHADDQSSVHDYHRGIKDLEDGEVRTHEHRALHKDGSVIWVRRYDTPFRRDADGKLTQIVGFSFNITGEKEASEALKLSEAQLLEAQDIARIGSYISYPDGRSGKVSPVIQEIFELDDPNNFRQYLSRIHPADKSMVIGLLKEAYEETGVYNCTYRYTNSQGERWLDCRGRVSYDANRGMQMLSGTVQDVTEQRALLEELSEKASLYREAQAIARMGSWRYEIGADVTFWSDELLHIYGLEEKAGLRNRDEMRHYTVAEDRERVRTIMDNALAKGEDSFDIRFRIRTPAGELKHLFSRGLVLTDVDGNPVRVVGTVQDLTEEQMMIERLAESRARYKEAQALAKVGNWTHDYNRGTRYWSDEMCRIFGLTSSPTAPSAQEFASFIHPADRQRLLQRHKVMSEKAGTYSSEYRVGVGGEEQQWIRMRTESLADAEGRVIALHGTVQDITAEKAAEQQVLKQQTFIRKVTDLAPSIITVFDAASGAYEFVSEGLTTLMGYEADAMLHSGPNFLLQRCHPDDLQSLLTIADSLLSAPVAMSDGMPGEAVHEVRYRLRNAEGEYRWIHTFATIFSRTEQGSVAKTLGISLDVTEQVRAEIAAREGEHFVRNVTQLVPSVISVVDVEEGKYVFMNETGAAILGQPVHRFHEEGLDVLKELAHADDTPAIEANFQDALRDAHAWRPGKPEPVTEGQFRIRAGDGGYGWMRSLTTPFLRNADGRVQQLISIMQDVTPLHEAEEVLKKRAELLQQSNQSLEEFAYVASHDLQEPLRKISTFGEMLSRVDVLQGDERAASLLQKITDSAKRMQTLINDLLDISVISREKSFETVNIGTLLREVLQTLEHKIESTGAVIETAPLPDAVVISAQIRQLFQNLLSNALKFRRPNEAPHVRITARTLFSREAQELGLPGHQPYVEISFKDNGIGFSNDYAQKIFTIFQRLHGRSEYEGSGIGLAICRKIVEHHGGIISATGELGKGSVFTVVLPV